MDKPKVVVNDQNPTQEEPIQYMSPNTSESGYEHGSDPQFTSFDRRSDDQNPPVKAKGPIKNKKFQDDLSDVNTAENPASIEKQGEDN